MARENQRLEAAAAVLALKLRKPHLVEAVEAQIQVTENPHLERELGTVEKEVVMVLAMLGLAFPLAKMAQQEPLLNVHSESGVSAIARVHLSLQVKMAELLSALATRRRAMLALTDLGEEGHQ